MQTLGYYVCKGGKPVPEDVFVAIHEEEGGTYIYRPRVDKFDIVPQGYTAECVGLTKERYLSASGEFTTPSEYI